jgi:prophage regulatory protein
VKKKPRSKTPTLEFLAFPAEEPVWTAQVYNRQQTTETDIVAQPHGPIPVSKSTWWAGVKDGRFPKPVKLSTRVTAWRVEDIRDFIESGVE